MADVLGGRLVYLFLFAQLFHALLVQFELLHSVIVIEALQHFLVFSTATAIYH